MYNNDLYERNAEQTIRKKERETITGNITERELEDTIMSF